MEIILKPHYQIELPQEICCKLDLEPGIRFELEVDARTGRIILIPVRSDYEPIHKPHLVILSSEEETPQIKSASL